MELSVHWESQGKLTAAAACTHQPGDATFAAPASRNEVPRVLLQGRGKRERCHGKGSRTDRPPSSLLQHQRATPYTVLMRNQGRGAGKLGGWRQCHTRHGSRSLRREGSGRGDLTRSCCGLAKLRRRILGPEIAATPTRKDRTHLSLAFRCRAPYRPELPQQMSK